MFWLNRFILLLVIGSSSCRKYNIVFFGNGFSPPETIPDDADKIYSVPLNQIMSRPIHAHFLVDGHHVRDERNSDLINVPFSVESIDLDVYHKKSTTDEWKKKGGRLCQWAKNDQYRTRRLEKIYCGEGKKSMVLDKNLIMYNGDITIEGLFHHHKDYHTVPKNKRVIRVTVLLPDSTTVTNVTNPVLIETAAWTLKFTQLPQRVMANTEFDILMSVVDINNNVVTTGLDSMTVIQLRIAWEYTKENNLTHIIISKVRLVSNDQKTHLEYHDTILCKQARKGVVKFSHVRILDFTEKLKFNATFRQSARLSPLQNRRLYLEHQRVLHVPYGGHRVILSSSLQVTEQRPYVLRLMVEKLPKTVMYNHRFYPKLVLELKDTFNRRIYSGKYSNTPVRTVLQSKGKLSSDSAFSMHEGRGVFAGSICWKRGMSVNETATLHFEIHTHSGIIKSTVIKNILLNDSLRIATFYDHSKDKHYLQFTKIAETFIEMMRATLLDNKLRRRKLTVDFYDNKSDVDHTLKVYKEMIKAGEKDPTRTVYGVVGMGSNQLTKKMNTFISISGMSLVGVKETYEEFSNTKLYKHFNRISWSEQAVIQNVLLAAQSRQWTDFIVITLENEAMTRYFYEEASRLGLNSRELTIPVDRGRKSTLILDNVMRKIKLMQMMIIFLCVGHPLNGHILRAAIRNELSCMHGYQWVTLEQFTWEFPWTNDHIACKEEPTCTTAFKGLHAFSSTYEFLGHFLTPPMMKYDSDKLYGLYQANAKYALAYDAILIYLMTIRNLLKKDLTITGQTISQQMRKITSKKFLTGKITLDRYGNRPGYYGFLVTVNPPSDEENVPVPQVAMYSRFFVGISDTYQWELRIRKHFGNGTVAPVIFPNTKFMTKREFETSSVILENSTHHIREELRNSTPEYFIEKTIANFFCKAGCGGEKIDNMSVVMYEFGNCTGMDECQCKEGYDGKECEVPDCNCNYGECKIPNVCTCLEGWMGDECNWPVCESCVHGMCSKPNYCKCDLAWIGKDCTTPFLYHIFTACGVVAGIWFLVFIIKKCIERRKALKNLSWLVLWDDVTIGEASTMYLNSDKLAPNIATWKNNSCYLQRFNIASLSVDDQNLRREILHIKSLKHQNIVSFIGACLQSPHVCILVELCTKGSLADLLANDSVQLDWDFRFAILKDICHGMTFIHNEVQSHGRLKSSNCLIDKRWCCKIAGHGLPTMRWDAPRIQAEGAYYSRDRGVSSLLWTAPELLKVNSCLADVRNGTKEGDVYSFGIILSEVITHDGPYATERAILTDMEIINLVRYLDSPENNDAKLALSGLDKDYSNCFRPAIDHSCMPTKIVSKMIKLLGKTWNQDPKKRPTFKSILGDLNSAHPVKGGIVDNLVNMLQKYSTELEAIVAEKSRDLVAEKHKTEELVSQLLPKKVAQVLQSDGRVDPEFFDCVTIFFSDIVGFTSIAQISTPLQVVALLNDLYSTFDGILDRYDVYKVETIGDAYMVVSGLPIRNNNLHAGEIATMSLDLVASMIGFKIRHMPNRILHLRVGLHSGPVVAGVVGQKMPRYCLTGDTVNTASRLESTSKALKIHMSEETAKILQKLKGYYLKCRGETELKGKGKMMTYWLLGKQSFIKQLPIAPQTDYD